MFSIVVVPFYIPIFNAWGFQFFCVSTNTLYFLFFFSFDETHYSCYKLIYSWSFPGDTSEKESSHQCKGHKRRAFHLCIGRSPGGRHGKDWVPKNWRLWDLVLEKTLESPLDCKEIHPVHPKGNQSWLFIGMTDAKAETPILGLSDVKNWLIWKDPDAGKDWGGKKRGR